MTTRKKPAKLDKLALLISAVLAAERAAAFKEPVRRMSKKRVKAILSTARITQQAPGKGRGK